MEDNIDINLLLKYFRCETNKEEDKAVGRFVADDPDGSHAKAYKEARIIFETLEVNAAAAEKFGPCGQDDADDIGGWYAVVAECWIGGGDTGCFRKKDQRDGTQGRGGLSDSGA